MKRPIEYPLWQALAGERRYTRYRFHVPAHSISRDNYWLRFDLTELPGLDCLYSPAECIARAQELAAETFQAGKTFFLAGGSSAGIIASVAAGSCPGDRLLVGRNAHRSVAAGLILSGAAVTFLPIREGPGGLPLNLDATTVAGALQAPFPERTLLLVTSPSYWGICSPLPAIAAMARSAGISLIVDEAHGGHFLFHPALPEGAAAAGAEVWVNSAHKTLGALTPGAYLHIAGNSRIDVKKLEKMLSLVQTSSPSYPVLLSLDLTRGYWQKKGGKMLAQALELAAEARREINRLENLCCLSREQLPGDMALDPLRLTIMGRHRPLNSRAAQQELREKYGIQVEMAGFNYILAIVHPGLPAEAIKALLAALRMLDGDRRFFLAKQREVSPYPLPAAAMSPREGAISPCRYVKLAEAAGLVAAQLVTPFPPGIPVLYPGELVTAALVERIKEDLAAGVSFMDLHGGQEPYLAVVRDM